MKILEYDEVDGQQVMEMNLRCFGWFFTPKQVRKIRKVDHHLPDYFSLYAVDKEMILCQVGVARVDTQTTQGLEKIGFIWGVCTTPNCARKGYAQKLMEEAHSRLIADGIRFSVLGTGKSMVAYALYKNLGYVDFRPLSWGLKEGQPKNHFKKGFSYASTTDNEVFVELFKGYSKSLLGFVHRPKNFLQIKKVWGWPSINMKGIFTKNSRNIGYLLANKEKKNIRIFELCCPKNKDVQRCIEALEMRFKPQYISFEWMAGTSLMEALVGSGFKLLSSSWGTIMIKDLEEKHSIDEIRRSYGLEEDRYHMTSLDIY